MTDFGTGGGLWIKASCVWKGWGSAKTDTEFWKGYKTPKGAVADFSTSEKKR